MVVLAGMLVSVRSFSPAGGCTALGSARLCLNANQLQMEGRNLALGQRRAGRDCSKLQTALGKNCLYGTQPQRDGRCGNTQLRMGLFDGIFGGASKAEQSETGSGDWEEMTDESLGARYYWNTVTGETTWEKPEGMTGKESPERGGQTGYSFSLLPLAPGERGKVKSWGDEGDEEEEKEEVGIGSAWEEEEVLFGEAPSVSASDLQQWADGSDVTNSEVTNDEQIDSPGVEEYPLGLGLAPVQTFFPQASRMIAIGDIHGDEGALMATLRMAKCVDAEGNWCGGTAHVVQIGDVLDRGDSERSCMERLFELKRQAAAAGGAVHVLLGNHEIMNVDFDFDYVGIGGFADWEPRDSPSEPSSLLETMAEALAWGPPGVPRKLKSRAAAFTAGSGFAALMLSEMPLVIQLGDTVCVHGGLETEHVDAGIHRINLEINEWLRGVADRPTRLDRDDSPIWSRAYSAPADRPLREKDARRLEEVLYSMGARRMIVGHTPQAGGINCFCTANGYEVWRTDTGMSRWVKNGPVECLEILADGTAHVLTRTGVVPGVVRKIDEGAEFVQQKRANSGAGKRGYTVSEI